MNSVSCPSCAPGEIVLRDPGGPEVIEAPPLARISLELLHTAGRNITVRGDRISFGSGRMVEYEVIEWDRARASLVVRKVWDTAEPDCVRPE